MKFTHVNINTKISHKKTWVFTFRNIESCIFKHKIMVEHLISKFDPAHTQFCIFIGFFAVT